MTDKHIPAPRCGADTVSGRRYVPPRLREFGPVRALTQAGTVAGVEMGGGGGMGMGMGMGAGMRRP